MKGKLMVIEPSNMLELLKVRFEKNMHRHETIDWKDVEAKLKVNPLKIEVLFKMEETGGEPDVIGIDDATNEFIFCDCSKESPSGRRSLCFDDQALNDRKEHKPKNSVSTMANELGIKLLNEEEYSQLQQLESFDAKTSSWIETPEQIRTLGGALFCDYRYGTIFVYHNGASSYYAARGFRGLLKV